MLETKFFVPTPRVNKKSCVVISGGLNQMLFFPSESNGVVFRKEKSPYQLLIVSVHCLK